MSKEPMSKIKKIIILLSSLFLVSIAALYYLNKKHIVNLNNITSYWHTNNTDNTNEQANAEQNDNKEEAKEPEKKVKSLEEKQATMTADAATMKSLGLYFDYANMTYKLPLNMIVVDDFEKYNLSMTKRYDITKTEYEYIGEHDTYVKVFNGAMTIPQMQYYSLVYSENTPAYALGDRLGGMSEVYKMYNRYGESKGELKTFSADNKTTTNYYIQVLQHLWDGKEKYKDLRRYIGESFPGEYYKRYLPNLQIEQKPGYVNDALNVDAIVYEKTPYIVALYTAGLGGITPANQEINLVGLNQVGELAYVINEWHRVNMNM